MSRCFFICEDQYKPWTESFSACYQFNIDGQKAGLAIDDSTKVHQVLTEVMSRSRSHTAWVGGKTRTLYWNWMPTTGMTLTGIEHC